MSEASNVSTEPLNKRLRAEAAEWDEEEPIKKLLLEAADAVEHLAAEVARLQ